VLDVDTIPDAKNVRTASKFLEVMALDEIVKEIMDSNSNATVTYSDDGSKKQGAGSFTVKGIIIGGKYRALPTMNIASESKANLAELKITTLKLLSAASKVDSKDLYEKIDFVITDQTAHNFNVETVVNKQSTESTHGHLLYNVYPSLMFNRVIIKYWFDHIEDGRDKIYSKYTQMFL